MMQMEKPIEARAAVLAGTRMLIMEECFDALVDALIASGAIPQNAAAVMLDHLAERFISHSAGDTDTGWAIDRDELFDQAVRLKIRAKRDVSASASAPR
jgi:hypothetical protein